MKKNGSLGIWIVVLIALVAGGFFYWQHSRGDSSEKTAATTDAVAPPAAPTEAPIRYPVAEKTAADAEHAGTSALEKPIPALDNSDPSMIEIFVDLLGKGQFETLLNLQNIIHNFVVTIDSLGGHKLPLQFSPFTPLEGTFVAKHDGENRTLSSENFARFAPVITLIQRADSKKLVAIYVRYYSLFQAAYSDLGMRGYFNDRLVDAIDKLISTPTAKEPVQLLGEDPFYKFGDNRLENLAAGQKILVRMGPENAQIVRNKLKELRANLVSTN